MSDFALPQAGLLRSMHEEWLAHLTGFGQFYSFKPNETIICQEQEQSNIYVIINGRLGVYRDVEGKEVNLAILESGECFGEVSIFEPAPASATVKTLTSGALWYMNVQNLQEYMDTFPYEGCTLLLGINQQLSRRLRAANETIRKHNVAPGFLSIRARIKATGQQKK